MNVVEGCVLLLLVLFGVNSLPACEKTCTPPLVLYTKTCVCLPKYVLPGCSKKDPPECARVIKAGFCNTFAYMVACANGCNWCDKDYVAPPDEWVHFFKPDKTEEDLFAVDCGPPPTLLNGDVTTSATTFTFLARYKCNKGYQIQGHGVIKCQGNGTWSELEATCSQITSPTTSPTTPTTTRAPSDFGLVVALDKGDPYSTYVLDKKGGVKSYKELPAFGVMYACYEEGRVYIGSIPMVSYTLKLDNPITYNGTESFPYIFSISGNPKKRQLYVSAYRKIVQMGYDGSNQKRITTKSNYDHFYGMLYTESKLYMYASTPSRGIYSVTHDGTEQYQRLTDAYYTNHILMDNAGETLYWVSKGKINMFKLKTAEKTVFSLIGPYIRQFTMRNDIMFAVANGTQGIGMINLEGNIVGAVGFSVTPPNYDKAITSFEIPL